MGKANLLIYRILSRDEESEENPEGEVSKGQLSPKEPVELIAGLLRGMQGWAFDDNLTVEVTYKGETRKMSGYGPI